MQKMVYRFLISLLIVLSVIFGSTIQKVKAAENHLFAYTHLLPGPFTLPAGRLVVGTDLAYGVTDFFTIGTSILRDFYKIYNANAKLSLVDYESFACALTGGYEAYNYKDINTGNPDVSVTSWLPGAVFSFALGERVAIAVGGNLRYSSEKSNTPGVEASGFVRGARIESDLSWAYNPKNDKKKNTLGNVFSPGVSYDITYKMLGMGFSHHWPGFQLGFHYYPSAKSNQVQPIISGGMIVDM